MGNRAPRDELLPRASSERGESTESRAVLAPSLLARFGAIAFAMCAACMLVTEWAVTRSALARHGTAVPLAVLFDLAVVLPFAFVLLVVRPRKGSLLGAAPVLSLGVLGASVLLAARTDLRLPLRVASGASEVVLLFALFARVRKGAGQLRASTASAGRDLVLRVATLSDPLLRVLGSELLVFYYAFTSLPFGRQKRVARAELQPPQESKALRTESSSTVFTYSKDSGLGGLLLAIGLVLTVEGSMVHLLLHATWPLSAWVLSALNVYALVWLVATFQASRLRPIVLEQDSLLVRTGLRWTLDIPRAAILAVVPLHDAQPQPRGGHTLALALGAKPNLLITFAASITAQSSFGKKDVQAIALYVDEPERLREALSVI